MRTIVLVLCSLGLAMRPALAEEPQKDAGPVTELVTSAEPTRASYRDDPPISKSYLIPALEIVGFNIITNIGAQVAGQPWADISPSTMARNLRGSWVYDNDQFAINQFAHPYGGAMLYLAARSSGHGFWGSTAYGFVGSLMWEMLMENEPPSINDQLTTSIAGAFLGEALHRWGRAVLSSDPKPSIGRRVLAGVIDPIGTGNRAVFGDRWRLTPPPDVTALLAVGVNRQLATSEQQPLHVELAVSHGLPSDPLFSPRVPFDHFDLRAQVDVSGDEVDGYIDVRGIIVGSSFGEARLRALWGLYGTFDYWNPDHARAGAIGVGPGIAIHAAIGERGFAQATAVGTVIPFGAAGGAGDGEGPQRDYHHGPGLGQFLEGKLGMRGIGLLKVSARAIEIDGTFVGDGREAVIMTTFSALASLAPNHAIGVELQYAARSASFDDSSMSAFDQASQLRVMYAITSDSAFGGGY